MRRISTLTTTLALSLALVTAGCGSSSGSGDKLELTMLDYYTTGGGRDAVNWYIRKFEKEHSNVKVTRQSVPFGNFMPKVLQSASAGDLPNIVIIDNPNVPQVAATGQLRPFDDLPGYTTKGYYTGSIKECEHEGKHYCYPVGANSIGLFYNKKLLDAASIQPPATWDDLAAAAKKLTKPPTYGMAFSAPSDEQATWQLEPFFWTNGASLTKVDSPEFVQALELWATMVREGSVSKSVMQWAQAPDLTQQFLQKKAAMMVNGPWIFPDLDKAGWKYDVDYGIVPIPVRESGQKVIAPLGGETWTLGNSGDDEQKKMAWEFVKGLQSPDVMQHMTKAMYYLPTKPAVTEEFLKGGPEFQVFAEESLTARPRTTEFGANYPKVSQAIWTAIQGALTGTKTPAQALTEAQQIVSSVPRQ